MGYLRRALLSHVSNGACPEGSCCPGFTASPRPLSGRQNRQVRSSKSRILDQRKPSASKRHMDHQELPRVPTKWSFYNLKQSIDDPYKAFSVEALDSISSKLETEDAKIANDNEDLQTKEDSPSSAHQSSANQSTNQTTSQNTSQSKPHQPLFSKSTMRKSISPITEWIAFNPSDNMRLNLAYEKHDSEPVAVGHDRLLFEVCNFRRLRPIYWSIPYSTKVVTVHWVFSDTLTPINPDWDAAILPHFVNFIDNLATYGEVLMQAQNTDPATMRVLRQRLELTQANRPLTVDLLFSPRNSCVYIFKADSSYICTKQAATALLSGHTPRGTIAVLRPFDFLQYKQLMSLPNRNSDDVNYEPVPVNSLILVFHGVGQKLSNSYSRVNFVYAIDKLRVEILKASESPDVYSHFPSPTEEGPFETNESDETNPTDQNHNIEGDRPSQVDTSDTLIYSERKNAVRNLVLAVNWRSAFDSEHIPDLGDITVPALQSIRQGFSDAMLDIPLYMSENRRPAMLAAAASEANRIYELVVKHHPSFLENGRTHVIGHSLGSLITADLLTHQPTVLNESNINEAPFKFQTHNYFCTGSMLGVFMLLKGETLLSRREYEKKHTDSAVACQPRPLGCFAVKNIYNIIHQLDLLSFLLNPTVKGADQSVAKKLVGRDGMWLEADELPTANPPASSSFLLSSFTSSHVSSSPSLHSSHFSATSSHTGAVTSTSISATSSTSVPKTTTPLLSSASATVPLAAAGASLAAPHFTPTDSSPSSPGTPPDSPVSTPSPNASSNSISTLGKLFASPFSRFIGSDGSGDGAADGTSEDVAMSMGNSDNGAVNEGPKHIPEEVVELEDRFKALNENGQIDWKIPQPSSYIPSHYLKMFTAHFDYWSNKEIARFLAIECGRQPGIENTAPEHRVKWTYK